MAVSRFNGSFRRKSNVLSNLTPTPVVQENVAVPAGEWKPAAWLPVEWSDSVSEDYFVISTYKAVALDREERLCPAGYRLHTTIASTFLTYTSTDVEMGVIDIRTGEALLSSATGAVAPEAVASALLSRGLVIESELGLGGVYNPATQSHVTAVIEAFISLPVGLVIGDVYVWAGDEPNLNFVNYQKQHLITFITEIQLKVPHLANSTASTSGDLEAATTWAAAAGDGEVFPDATAAGTELYVTPTLLASLARYDGVISATDDLAGYALEAVPACKNTERTPLSVVTTAAFMVNEKPNIATVKSAGDYYWDHEVGMLIVYAAGGAQVATAATTVVTYYVYDGGSAASHHSVHLCDDARPGQFITVDVDSNFIAVDITPGTTNLGGIIGRVYRLLSEPVGYLDQVETAWTGANMTSADKMPGTATSGYSDLITLSGEAVADQIAILNIKIN